MEKLDGKIALVSGAGRGIGRAVALKLAGEGARVVANDLDVDEVAETVASIRAAGGEAHSVAGDVTAADFGDRFVQAALEVFGDVHIVINNAGYIWNGSALKHTDEQWQAMLDVHVSAPFRILRAAGRHFREVAGAVQMEGPTRKVVNISSVSAVHGAATQVSYSAGKAALIGMTKTLSREWGHYNVTVNCVAFGHIETRLTRRFDARPDTISIKGREFPVGLDSNTFEKIRTRTPLGRTGSVEDAAGALYLFCIPESDFVSGEVLICSGGLVI